MIPRDKVSLTLIVIFVLYAVVRLILNLSVISDPGTIEDTTAYLRISQEDILNQRFWADARPLVFPLLLKLTRQNLPLISLIQVLFSIFSWGCLAFLFVGVLRNGWVKVIAFLVLLALSLVRHFSNWDYMIMTESLSFSFLILFISCGIWLIGGWSGIKAVIFIVVGMFFAFVRDTNAYVLLFLSVLLLFVVIFRWIRARNLVFVFSFVGIFLLSNWTSDLGARWVFPLNNNIGKRVLPSEQAVRFFEECGMPITPELMSLAGEFANGQNRAFYNDPALEDYRLWLYSSGKTCYMKYLFSDLPRNSVEVIQTFEYLISYSKSQAALAPGYDPVVPFFLERFVYPVNNVLWLWLFVTVVSLFLVWRREWQDDPIWGVGILLCLLVFPHLFVTWFGDAMSPERHSLSVGLQFALSVWFVVLLSIDRFVSRSVRVAGG